MHPRTYAYSTLACRLLTISALVPFMVALAGVLSVAAAGGADRRDCASADTPLRVGVVIDFGLLVREQQAPSSVAPACVGVNDGVNGFQILDAANHTYSVDGSGLLCAIDGFPGKGECGARTSSGYRYWAYFHGGSGGWSYSGLGPDSFKAHSAEVEGWHFVEGKGNKTDPAPAGPSDPARICAPGPTTAPQTMSTQPGGAASTTPAPGSDSGSGAVGGARVPSDRTNGQPVPAASTTALGSARPAALPIPNSTVLFDPNAAVPDQTGAGANSSSAPVGAALTESLGASGTPGTAAATGGAGEPSDGAVGMSPASSRASEFPIGFAVGAVVILVMIGAATRRFRLGNESRP